MIEVVRSLLDVCLRIPVGYDAQTCKPVKADSSTVVRYWL